MSVSFLDHSTRQLPTINVTWVPNLGPHPAHTLGGRSPPPPMLNRRRLGFCQEGPSQEALVSYQNALVEEELRQNSRHLLDNVPEP